MKSSLDKQVSVIFVNFKSEKKLFKSLCYFKENPEGIKEIIIINNDQKESLDEIRNVFPEIRIISLEKNVGFGKAVNIGAREAVGKILFILNPDTKIISGKISEISDILKEEGGILGAQIINDKKQIQPWIAGVQKTLFDLLKNNLGIKKSQKIWESKKKIEADWVSATAMFIEKDLFERLGGFDENIFMYFEDVDLCKRARSAQEKIVFFPNFIVEHIGGASFENKEKQKKVYYESQEYYFKKHCRKWEFLVIKLIRKIFYAL